MSMCYNLQLPGTAWWEAPRKPRLHVFKNGATVKESSSHCRSLLVHMSIASFNDQVHSAFHSKCSTWVNFIVSRLQFLASFLNLTSRPKWSLIPLQLLTQAATVKGISITSQIQNKVSLDLFPNSWDGHAVFYPHTPERARMSGLCEDSMKVSRMASSSSLQEEMYCLHWTNLVGRLVAQLSVMWHSF